MRGGYEASYRKKCRACGALVNIQLHHMSYHSLGRETHKDLVWLCRSCHLDVHARPEDNLVAATWFVIKARNPRERVGRQRARRTQDPLGLLWAGGHRGY